MKSNLADKIEYFLTLYLFIERELWEVAFSRQGNIRYVLLENASS